MSQSLMKTCFRCLVEQPITEFYPHPASKDGHINKCKTCARREITAAAHVRRLRDPKRPKPERVTLSLNKELTIRVKMALIEEGKSRKLNKLVNQLLQNWLQNCSRRKNQRAAADEFLTNKHKEANWNEGTGKLDD